MLAQIHLPEVGLTFEGSKIIQTLAILAHDGIAQITAVRCQTDDAVLQALEFYLDGLDGIGIGLLVVFLFVFLVILLLVFFLVLLLEFLQQRIVFCRETITVVGILCQESQEHVVLTAPRGMTAHAIALTLEEDGLTVHHPTGALTHVGALRDGMNLAALSADDALISIRIATIGNITQHEPLAIGTPLEVEATVLTIPLAAIRHLRDLLGLQIDHHQFDAILDKGYLLAIGTIFGRAALYLREVDLVIQQIEGRQFWEHAFFLDQCGVGKVQVFLPDDAGRVELPVAVTLRSIDDSPAVGCKIDISLCTCCLRNPARGGIFRAGDKDFATCHKGNLLTVLAYHRLMRLVGETQVGNGYLVIAGQRDIQFLGIGSKSLRVDVTIISIAEQSVFRHTQEPHGMCLEGGDGLWLACFGCSSLGLTTIDIHAAAIALTQEVERLAVGTHHGIAVLASMCRHIRMLTVLGIVEPDIACDR